MTAVNAMINSVALGEPVVSGKLAMMPLIRRASEARAYRTLDEAVREGNVAVTEVSEAGSVPQLRLRNSTDVPVLLIDGDTLVGAKQNRTLNISIYAPAGQEISVPVSCVEAGRWERRSWSFSASRDHMFASGRARMMDDVHRSMDAGFEPHAQQGRVWADIDRKMRRMGVDSPTRAMDDMFAALDSKIEDVTSAFETQANQVGAIFSLNGRVVGMDCFDHAESFSALLPKLLRSYGLDALDEHAELSQSDVKTGEEFLLLVSHAKQVEDTSPGLGVHVRLRGENIIGSALLVDGKAVHVCAFWADPTQSEERAMGES